MVMQKSKALLLLFTLFTVIISPAAFAVDITIVQIFVHKDGRVAVKATQDIVTSEENQCSTGAWSNSYFGFDDQTSDRMFSIILQAQALGRKLRLALYPTGHPDQCLGAWQGVEAVYILPPT